MNSEYKYYKYKMKYIKLQENNLNLVGGTGKEITINVQLMSGTIIRTEEFTYTNIYHFMILLDSLFKNILDSYKKTRNLIGSILLGIEEQTYTDKTQLHVFLNDLVIVKHIEKLLDDVEKSSKGTKSLYFTMRLISGGSIKYRDKWFNQDFTFDALSKLDSNVVQLNNVQFENGEHPIRLYKKFSLQLQPTLDDYENVLYLEIAYSLSKKTFYMRRYFFSNDGRPDSPYYLLNISPTDELFNYFIKMKESIKNSDLKDMSPLELVFKDDMFMKFDTLYIDIMSY
jgi:hypothetical protein